MSHSLSMVLSWPTYHTRSISNLCDKFSYLHRFRSKRLEEIAQKFIFNDEHQYKFSSRNRHWSRCMEKCEISTNMVVEQYIDFYAELTLIPDYQYLLKCTTSKHRFRVVFIDFTIFKQKIWLEICVAMA